MSTSHTFLTILYHRRIQRIINTIHYINTFFLRSRYECSLEADGCLLIICYKPNYSSAKKLTISKINYQNQIIPTLDSSNLAHVTWKLSTNPSIFAYPTT